MPKSRTRSKAVYTPPPRATKGKVSPAWLAPTMLATLVIGLVWIVVFYVSNENWPVSAMGPGNLVVGFAFIIVGLGLATRWR